MLVNCVDCGRRCGERFSGCGASRFDYSRHASEVLDGTANLMSGPDVLRRLLEIGRGTSSGNYIEAIKRVRAEMGLDLKGAKDLLDALRPALARQDDASLSLAQRDLDGAKAQIALQARELAELRDNREALIRQGDKVRARMTYLDRLISHVEWPEFQQECRDVYDRDGR